MVPAVAVSVVSLLIYCQRAPRHSTCLHSEILFIIGKHRAHIFLYEQFQYIPEDFGPVILLAEQPWVQVLHVGGEQEITVRDLHTLYFSHNFSDTGRCVLHWLVQGAIRSCSEIRRMR